MGRREAGGDWPLVGIDEAVGELVRTWRSGHVGGVVLTGSAGVGKTAMASAVLRAVRSLDGPGERVVATPAGVTVPFGALAPLLAASDVARDRPALAVEVRHALERSRSSGDRLLLVVDDLPLLDAVSAAEVAGLVHAGLAFLLGTARTGAGLPVAVTGLEVEGAVTRRLVEPMGPSQLARAAEAFLGGPLDDDALDRIGAQSRGVPLHARELVQANVASGVLRPNDDRDADSTWGIRGDLVAPPNLIELVGSRFALLDDRHRDAFEIICVAQPLPLDVAEALAGLDVLVELERSDLVAVDEERGVAVVRPGHPLFEEVARSSRGVLHQRQVVERAAVVLAGSGEDLDLALRAACLRLSERHLDRSGRCTEGGSSGAGPARSSPRRAAPANSGLRWLRRLLHPRDRTLGPGTRRRSRRGARVSRQACDQRRGAGSGHQPPGREPQHPRRSVRGGCFAPGRWHGDAHRSRLAQLRGR